ncbi:MAG TPA: cache domain-containing protein, partial [Vicinamibacterales bacterium]|nr:cache domain-containing protein [Vicinamibacterales bacterium]
MGDQLAPGMPQDGGDARSRVGSPSRVRLPSLRLPALGDVRSRIAPPSWPPSPFVAALAVLAVAVMFLAGLTYYGASTFSARAADRRAADEAQSLAHLGSRLATGDAFDGYIQILRYAEDPVLNDRNSSEIDRLNAMQRLLYINVNKFQSLSIVSRAGVVLASTDPNIQDVNTSGALLETRSTLGPANSDITMPRAGERGYIDYTAPLREPDGSVWGILLGRADPARIFRATLDARADGSQTVIINNQGQFAAGVPDELLRLPWQGRPMDSGAVFARIAGTESICGLAAIGQGTQMDRGLNVAACLPASIIQADREWATGKQLIITIAGAVLAVVVGALLLWYLLRIAPAYAAPAVTPALAAEDEPAPAAPPPPTPIEIIAAEPPPDPVDTGPAVPVADVDALALIDAFERRGARIAAELRERV